MGLQTGQHWRGLFPENLGSHYNVGMSVNYAHPHRYWIVVSGPYERRVLSSAGQLERYLPHEVAKAREWGLARRDEARAELEKYHEYYPVDGRERARRALWPDKAEAAAARQLMGL